MISLLKLIIILKSHYLLGRVPKMHQRVLDFASRIMQKLSPIASLPGVGPSHSATELIKPIYPSFLNDLQLGVMI